MSKKVVHDGAHADEALLAQSVPVHAAQDVDCLIHLTTVEVLEDELDQAQLSWSEDACHKTQSKAIKPNTLFTERKNTQRPSGLPLLNKTNPLPITTEQGH